MKMIKRAFAIWMAVLMIVLAVPVGAYTGIDFSALFMKADAAISYSYYPVSAAKWAEDHCMDYKSVLLGKGYYSKGGDCANFVSQCLYMGGIDMQDIWNTAGWYAHWNTKDIPTTYQGSFIRVDQLYNFLVNQLNASVKNNPSASDLKVGDVLIYAAKTASDKTHSAIVIEINNGTPKIAYHSIDGKKDREITTLWRLGFKSNLIWRVRPTGQPCVNPNPRSIWVYKVKKSTALRKSASTSASVINTFLANEEGEYALVTQKSGDGKWGKTYRYGKWGWVKLSDFSGGSKYTASAGSHLFGSWITTKPATCLVDGQQTRTCTRCGYKETKTLKGGHNINPHATCLDYGVCSICGAQVENPLGHDWDDGTATVQPSCLEPGVKTFVCRRDASHTYTEAIPALGHDYQIADIGNATCVTAGMVKYSCSRCGDSFEQLADENNAWTDWTTEELNVPANRVRSKTQYRYSDKITKTSSQSTESGWTPDGSTWQWGPYGDWSSWSKTAVTASESRAVETKTVTDQAAYDEYLLFHIYYKNKNDNVWYYTYSLTYAKNNAVGGNYDHQKRWTKVSEIKTTGKEYGAFIQYVKKSGYYIRSGELWYYESDCASDHRTIPAVTHTEYRYRDRNKVYTYYFYKWSDFSEWQDEPVSASDTRTVETRTVYQYDLRALGHDFSVASNKEFVKQNQFLHSNKQGNQITLLDGETCNVSGYTCSRCGAESPDAITVAHQFTGDADETITVDGGTVYKEYCDNGCGCYILWDDNCGDDPCAFERQTVAPTCTVNGYTLYTCTVHGETLQGDFVPALGHEIPEDDAGVITRYPTCTEPGEITHYCVRYDEGATCDHAVTETILPLGHVMTYHAATISCTEDGNVEYYSCEQCNKFFADETGNHQLLEEELLVPATGHNGLDENGNEVWTLEKEVMCGDPGLERMYCQNPWCKTSDDYCEVHSTQHTFMIDERQTYIDPDYYVRSADFAVWNEAEAQWIGTTCKENGVLHWTCRNCEGTETEHGYDSMVDPAPHTPGPWTVVEPLSCTHDGVEVQKCTVCGIDLDYRYIESQGHSTSPLENDFASSDDRMELISSVNNVCGNGTVDTYQCTHVWDGQRCDYTAVVGEPADHALGEWHVVIPATCEKGGLEQRDCIINNDYSETRETDPLGHDLVLVEHIDATCTEPGKNSYRCQRTGCDYTVEEDLAEEPALGHDLSGSYTVTKKASCLENGEKELLCCRVNHGTVCNEKLDMKTILARGHNMSDWIDISAAGTDDCRRKDCLNTETEEFTACTFNITEGHAWGDWTASGDTHIRFCANIASHVQTEAHAWTRIGSVDADCTHAGSITYRCDVCSAQKTETVDPKGHQLVKTEAVAAKCLEDGNSAYYTCSVCGLFFSDEGGQNEIAENSWVLGALGHDWGAWADNGDGNHIRVCKRDASHVETDVHAWDNGVITIQPKAETAGEMTYTCTVCGAVRTEPIPVKGWTVTFTDDNGDDLGTQTGATLDEAISKQADPVKDADAQYTYTFDHWEQVSANETTGEAAYVAVYTETHNSYEVRFLDENGDVLKTETVAYGSGATAPADPEKADDENKHYEFTGWDKDFSNITGNLTVTATYTGEAHIEKEVVTVPATCEGAGEKRIVCDVCGRLLDTQTLDPLGHDWGAWSASGDNHIRTCKRDASHVETAAHVWNDGVVTKEPTCKEQGSKLFTCTVCAATKTEPIAINPNNHSDYGTHIENAADATCLEKGYTGDTVCNGCGVTLTEGEDIAALGHDWGVWTDNEDGNHIRICKRDASHVETAAHVWNEWETVTAPTYDENGLEKRVCPVCSAEQTRLINKLQSWTVTFVVDDADGTFEYEGKTYTVVGKPVRFTSVDDVINPPAVPTIEGYVGQWKPFTLTENDLVVPAIYTKKADTEESELETTKESSYENGIAEITLDAFARTNNVKTELGAKPYDIILVVDQSGSMAYVMNEDREPSARYGETAADTRNAKLKGVANSFVDMVAATGLDHRIAIVGFGMASKAASGISAYQNTAVLTPEKTQFGLNQNMQSAYEKAFVSVKTDKATLTSAINGIQAKGATAADLGFEMAKGILANTDSTGRKRLVIFLTDGEPTYSSTFEDDVANRTVNYAYLLKNVYDASVYSIAISGKANPEDETQNFNRFLHQTSSNYPFAKFGDSGTVAPKKAYYYATTDAAELENIFKDVFASTVSNTISFDKVTLYDTISKYFTMTVSQEESLRASLKAEYGATHDDVVITRNEDGTTSLSVCVAPKAVFENNIQTGYGATVTFRVSANENAVEAGYYDTNTADAGVLDGNGNQVASFEIPRIHVPQNRVFVTFKAGDEIYEIRDVRADEEIIAPQSSIGVWHIEPGTTVTENGTVFEAVLNSNERIVKWNTGSGTVVQSYKIGQLIYAPAVDAPEGMSFSGWDNPVPNRMPTTNLEFTATFTPHTHAWKKTDTSGNCESGMTTKYRCVCGETKEEITAPKNHAYTAIITCELDKSVVTLTCSVCGAYTTQYINYQTQYDKQNKDRWGRPADTTTTSAELTLYNAQNVVIQPDADKPITVYIPITAEQKAAKDSLKVYRIEEGDQKTQVDSDVINDYMVLHLDHFSYYLISAEETLPTYGQTVCAIHGHSYNESVTPPTCTDQGYTTHTCSSCGDTYTDSEVPAKNHSYGAWAKLDDNQHQRVCANDATHVEKANHTWDAGTVTKPATCKTTGIKTYTCTACKAAKTETIGIAANAHSLTFVPAKSATTEAEGNVAYYHCTLCGKNYADQNGTQQLTSVTTDKQPKPPEPQKNYNDCKYCGEKHTGPFGWLIKFFHSILALFGLRK